MAWSVGTPMAGLPKVAAKDFTVASPMRKPVKLPGPFVTAKRSISSITWPASFKTTLTLVSKSEEWLDCASPLRVERTCAPRVKAILPARVVVSRLKVSSSSFVCTKFYAARSWIAACGLFPYLI